MRRKIIVISMIILLIALFYMIFNMGSETGLQRSFISDPSKDIWLLLAIGLGVFSLNLLMMRDADERKDNNDKR
ncbi:MAG: hypothetical protein DRP70_06585 [Spirochaetes bacterium]|nr:MAG: hypothetical protein DRP60_10410 [Spirochaetota bacterium]RKX76494.1 MAG: hypothetical protein DRP49_03275 [Spirochaetota bacterium]RKX88472.1 MAG: hypothetical protein DRP70_06585 [Spirochaetota bacterium]